MLDWSIAQMMALGLHQVVVPVQVTQFSRLALLCNGHTHRLMLYGTSTTAARSWIC